MLQTHVKEYIPEAVDVWAAGCCLYALLTGSLPFQSTMDVQSALFSRTFFFLSFQLTDHVLAVAKIAFAPLDLPTTFSAPLQELLRAMLSKDPAARPTFQQVPQLCVPA